ncbi:unnamed protein product, partial [Rotaria sp. Silwood1]
QGEIRLSDQPIHVGWFPANCVQIQTLSTPAPAPSTALYQNASGIKWKTTLCIEYSK